MTDNFVTMNTVQIQIQSVINFMSALGYIPDNTRRNLSFVNNTPYKAANRHISFKTAVRLHNSTLDNWKIVVEDRFAMNDRVNLATMWPVINVIMANAAKFVEKVKVVVSRDGRLVLNEENANLIRAVNPQISAML